MKFSFDSSAPNSADSRGSVTPKEEVEWVPLQQHPVFTSTSTSTSHEFKARVSRNLLAWDGSSRLYFWDSDQHCLHRISIRLADPDSASVLAASPSKVLLADGPINFTVNNISINRNGSALLLAGSDGLCIMYLYGRTSTKDNTIICRTVLVGSQIYFNGKNVIRTQQVSWHPYSDTHLGILSSDSVFRLFDLSSDLLQPEQEYYLQPVEPGRSKNAASICPVDFAFGGEHMWDKFTVFVLFADGSVYILCPVVPFGSVFRRESILEVYNDAHTFGAKSSHALAVSSSNMAVSWLEATFPTIAQKSTERGNPSTMEAHPYAIFDASISLQGPLKKLCHGGEEDFHVKAAECEGRAVSFLYDSVYKDSILVTAWSGGQLQIDALADEIQPVWNISSPPRLRVDGRGRITALAMICESIIVEHTILKPDQPHENNVWLGHPPPLLRLAIVDLALPGGAEIGHLITLFVDPLMPERIFTLHEGGIDSIVLHFLPFTSQSNGKDENIRTPSVHPVLSTCQGETYSPSPLHGFLSLSDSFGCAWILALSAGNECIVLEMKTWNLLLPVQVCENKKASDLKESDTPNIVSKELLSGPKVILVPQASPSLRSISADSIEGRATLHQYFKLFHENYVEYAHKVYFELKHHGPHAKKIIDDQRARLNDAQQKLLRVEEKQPILEERTHRAVGQHNYLEERLQRLRNLPGAQKKPLSRAERQFKSELDQFSGVELDALRSSIEALNSRLRRYTQSTKSKVNQQRQICGKKNYVQDSQISDLKSALAKLSLVNSENSKKLKLVESALTSKESSHSFSPTPHKKES